MAPSNTHSFMLVLCASILGATMANKPDPTPKTIIVGGSANWTFGFNYSAWAFQNGPFYVNDTLVFRYDPPSEKNTHPHSVYLVPDIVSFANCNLTNSEVLANETQGAGEGFHFLLKEVKPHYFACGASNGFHCKEGQMSFLVLPYTHGIVDS